MIGETFGPYRLTELLGVGGMGEVYKATDTHLRRNVAVKLLPRDASSSADRARFLREAQAASALNNPHIVTIHHVGSEQGRDYIVMEFVQGRTLRSLIDSGELTLEKCLDYAGQITRALSTAHSAGVIHRDLKPNNIMITPDGLAKVLDFGLAKMSMGGALPVQTDLPTVGAQLTKAGTVMGTPAYMSPEQAEGREVDPRSDIFSLGTVLYEMLTGKHPFKATSLPALVHDIVYREPPPLTSVSQGIPADFAPLIRKAMAKAPDGRYASADELRVALERVGARTSGARTRAGSPLLAAGARLPSWVRRHALGSAAGAALLIGAVVLLAVPVARDRAFSWLSSPSWRGEPAPFDLYNRGMELVTDYYSPENVDQAIDAFQRAIQKEPGYAPAYAGLAEAYYRKYRKNRDAALLDQAVRYADHAVELDGQLANARVAQGLAGLAAAEYTRAAAAFERALRLDPLNAKAHKGRASVLQRQGRPEEAEAAYERTLELAPADWEANVLLGSLHFRQGRYEEAVTSFDAVTEISPNNTIGYRNLGAAQHMLGNFPQAAAAFQRALQIQPDPFVYANLGTLYFFQGLYTQAAAAFQRSVELDPNNYLNWGNLGDSYRLLPEGVEDAREAYLRAIQLAREELSSDPEAVEVRGQLALYLARRGDADEARRELTRLGREPDLDPEVLYARALAYEAIGDREQALESLSAASQAGYSLEEIKKDPELVDLRKDVRYHRVLLDQSAADP